MGIHFVPVYGDIEVGSAIEKVEKVIAKIKTNKFDQKDKIALADAIVELKTAIDNCEDKD